MVVYVVGNFTLETREDGSGRRSRERNTALFKTKIRKEKKKRRKERRKEEGSTLMN